MPVYTIKKGVKKWRHGTDKKDEVVTYKGGDKITLDKEEALQYSSVLEQEDKLEDEKAKLEAKEKEAAAKAAEKEAKGK